LIISHKHHSTSFKHLSRVTLHQGSPILAKKDKKCLPTCCPLGNPLVKSNATNNHGFACGSPSSDALGVGGDVDYFHYGFPECGGMPEPAWNYSLIQWPIDNEDMIKDNQGTLRHI